MIPDPKNVNLNDLQIQPDDLPAELRQIADLIGLESVLALVRARGGEAIYIPKQDSVAAAARNRAIRAQFNGHNHAELARRYNLTVRWVNEIISEGRRRSCRSSVQDQLKLF